MITKTSGHFIINGSAISLQPAQVVSHRHDATVEEFATQQEMLEEHQQRHPELYPQPDTDIMQTI